MLDDQEETVAAVPTPDAHHSFPTLVTFETKKLIRLFNTPEEDYIADIMAHLKRREVQLRALPNYMSLQQGATPLMR